MDGAGTTIFDRIEQKLSAAGAEIDIENLKAAVSQYDAKIAANPADTEARIVGLELKLVMLARLLNAAVEVLPEGGHATGAAACAPETPFDEEGPAPAHQASGNGPRKKRLRQNPATGVIEEIEDVAEDNVIVADGRFRGAPMGKGGVPMKEKKECVFISAVDDENPGPSPTKKKG